MEAFNVAIVGGGPGCVAIMDMISAHRLREIRMNLIGVADIDPAAPGMKRARDLNIYTTDDYHDFFALQDLNLILELTGKPKITKSIQKEKPDHVRFMDHTVARFFWDFIHLEEERRIAEREAEHRIKEERDYTARILDNLTDAVFVVNKNRIIENANETFVKQFGAGHDSVIGLACNRLLFGREEMCEEILCPFSDATWDEMQVRHQEYMVLKEGKTLFYEADYSPLIGEHGQYAQCLVSLRDISGRKRLEMELERSQKKYKHLFEYAGEGIALFNDRGEILESNLSLSRMLGYSWNELVSMEISDLAENVSRKILENHLEDLKIMGFASVEMEFARKNGTPLSVEVGIGWLPEEKVFQAMIRDISTRKKLEKSRKLYSEKLEKEVEDRTCELRASQQETLRQKKTAEGIIYGSPRPMFVLDGSHRITYWNKACEQLTGYSSEKMIGTDGHWKPFYPHKRPLLADLIIEGDIETIHKLYEDMNIRKSSMVEGAYEAEHYFPHLGEDGTHLYFNAAPIKDDSGAIQGAIVTYQDFSERLKMTQEIRKREAFVQNLIQNSIDGIIATDSEGTIVIFNRGAADILGYSPEEVIGRMNYRAILSKNSTKKIRKAFYGCRYGPEGKIVNMEVEFLNRVGQPIPARLSGTLLYENKKEVGSVVFAQDLREIHRLQKEKAEAERMAAIGQTIAELAHYIKNILNGLKGGAYVINSAMKKNNMELVANGWKMIEKNIDQIANVVLDMLVYSRERKPDYQLVDPNEVVMDVLELMKERAEVSGVSIVRELTPELKNVSMDRTGIYRCLLNLVSNAIDACTLNGIMDGQGLVTVRTDVPEGWAVRFQVVDNGTGMDEETQKKLFRGLFTTKGYRGTGLGLPAAQKIVEDHHGRLFFESHLGKGTTFTLSLPVMEDTLEGNEA
jgi:PAS domain S-box-containing protein